MADKPCSEPEEPWNNCCQAVEQNWMFVFPNNHFSVSPAIDSPRLTFEFCGCRRQSPGMMVRPHLGADGTKPYRLMTATSALLSGGPPALTTAATSLKYCAPMSGERTINARATLP